MKILYALVLLTTLAAGYGLYREFHPLPARTEFSCEDGRPMVVQSEPDPDGIHDHLSMNCRADRFESVPQQHRT